jgi:hypothetical protein
MKITANAFLAITTAAILALGGTASLAQEQEAIDGCIDQLRAVGGPDGQSGEVISSEFSQAGTLVMIRDAGGSVWRCIGYSDGTVGELAVAQAADDGAGAAAPAATAASAEAGTETVLVKFAKGTTGAELTGRVAPGGSIRYVIGAKNGQFLYARVADNGAGLSYQIFNPDRSFLLEQMRASQEYRGQLWQSGDHVVEVINRGGKAASFNIIIGIE